MKEFIELTEELAKRVADLENQRKKVGEFLREINSIADISFGTEVLENKIFIPVNEAVLEDNKIAGVDGGMVKNSLHGMDIILLRAVGVIFNYKKNKLERVDYYPNPLPSPIPNIFFDPFSDIEFELSSNMERQLIEINTARETIEKFSPDILLLNGSIVPHYTEKPAENSLLFPTYSRMIDSYKKLLNTAKGKRTILAGVIEDSKGTRFCDILNQKLDKIPEIKEARILLEKTRDTNLLTYALNYGERTFAFSYSSEPAHHPILREFEDLAGQIYCFYLKTAGFDRPVRVDFLAHPDVIETANKISSILLATSNNLTYGFPSVLIEADLRARLSEKEIEEFILSLRGRIGNLSGLLDLRRKSRPF